MSKKRIDNRLNQLFINIKEAEDTADVPQEQRKPKPSTDQVDTRPSTHRPQIIKHIRPVRKATSIPVTETVTEISSFEPNTTLALPLRMDSENWGVLEVSAPDQEKSWSQEEQTLVKQVVDQLSLAMENARLFQQTQSRAEDLATLNELGRALAAELSLDQILQEIYRGVSRLIDTTNFYIGLYDSAKQEVRFALNVTESEVDKQIVVLPADQGITGHIIRTRQPVLIKEGVADWLQQHDMSYIGEPAQSWLGVPIILGDRVLGVLAVQNYKSLNAYDEHDQDMLMAIANQAAISIQNAELFQTTRDRAEEMASINRIIAAVSGFLDIDTSMGMVAEEISHLIRAQTVSIAFTDEQKENLRVVAGVPSKADGKPHVGLLLPINRNQATQHIMKNRSPLHIVDVPKSELAGLLGSETQGAYILPILLGHDILGIISLGFADPERVLSDREIRLLETVSIQTAIAIQKVRLFEETNKSREQLTEALRIGRMGYFEISMPAELMTITNELFALVETTADEEGGHQFRLRAFLRKFVMVEDIQSLLATIQGLYENPGRGKLSQEVRFRTKNGKLIWVENIYNIVRDADGSYSKIIGSSQDITERKQAEETLQRQNEYLAISAEIGRIITSTLDRDTLFTRTVNLIRNRFNFYHAAIFILNEIGSKAIVESATGDAGTEMKRRGHYLEVGSQSIVGKVAKNGESMIVNNTIIDPVHKPNPLLPDTRSEAAIPLRVGTRIIGVVDIQSDKLDAFSNSDISILQSLADQIAIAIDNARSYELAQQAVREIRELDRIKSQFLANMSHELRTPLNSIIGFSRVILKGIDGPTTDLQQQDLGAIYNSGQHLLRLINDILDLSKIEAGKMELAFEDVNLSETIQSVFPTISGLIKDKSIKLRHAIAEGLPIVRADPMRLRQVLINLLSNAAKFTDEGDIFLEAGVQADPAGQEEIMISVTDTGPGISLEDQEKLFQPFSQVDASLTRKTGGTGLGLSISRHLIELHGGRIGLRSTEGEGSTFYFTLPIPKLKEIKTDLAVKGDAKVILAIDDDAQIISLFERYLQPQGYQVVALTDPTKAKEYVKQYKPFAITLDIMMPARDGWLVLDGLKTDPETRDIPVIICSILQDEEKGFGLGATDYLVKPILEIDLLNSLNRLNNDGTIRDVLVIDDDPEDLRLIGKILNQSVNYRAILAEGGREGWQALSANPPHVVILDLFMRDMDGFTILTKLGTNPVLRDIPVIVYSTATLTRERQKQLTDFGQNIYRIGTLNENEIFLTLEKALNRLGDRKGE